VDKEHNGDVELAAGDDDDGNMRHTFGVVEAEAEATHPIVGKEHNLEEEPCDEKV
jgi:hypothetical protein